jgi:hypothetical protein
MFFGFVHSMVEAVFQFDDGGFEKLLSIHQLTRLKVLEFRMTTKTRFCPDRAM